MAPEAPGARRGTPTGSRMPCPTQAPHCKYCKWRLVKLTLSEMLTRPQASRRRTSNPRASRRPRLLGGQNPGIPQPMRPAGPRNDAHALSQGSDRGDVSSPQHGLRHCGGCHPDPSACSCPQAHTCKRKAEDGACRAGRNGFGT